MSWSRSSASDLLGAALALALAAGVPLLATPASAQEGCRAAGPRAAVCDVELRVADDRGRFQRIDPGRPLALVAGGALVLEVTALDERGRVFPPERVVYGLEPDRDCGSRVAIRDEGDGRFRVTAGAERGRCRAWLWIPGNLNLEWPLDFEVASRARDGYSRAEAEHIVQALYAAILGRAPDGAGFSAAVAEVQRGRLESQIRAMVASPEFRESRASLGPVALLEAYYRGLLGRAPDTGAVRTYMGQVERGRHADVVLAILRSEEFETQLFGKAGTVAP